MYEDRLLNIIKNLDYLLSTLEQVCAQKLINNVPSSEYDSIYINFELSKNSDIIFSVFNSNTKCIVKKIYTLPQLLKKCADIFSVMDFIDEDTINLYKKSKEYIYNTKTIISI